ncbi:quinon protein alcohol dehydrogenase-like superfamily [Hypoxylon cercidicola]|nr:quinon protein alcohol dehydrogenase-like superfamily [Hypoxylon cercidicola]
METGSLEQTVDAHGRDIFSFEFSYDSNLLALGSDDGTIKTWSIKTRSLQRTFKCHVIRRFRSIAFSHDSKLLAGTSWKIVKIWNMETGKLQKSFEIDYEWPTSFAFSYDLKLLAVGLFNGTIRILDTAATFPFHQTLKNEDHKSFIQLVKLSHDSTLLASGSVDTIKVWDTATGSLRKTLECVYEYASDDLAWIIFSRDSNSLASMTGKMIMVWDVATESKKQTLRMDHKIYSASFDDTGLYLDTDIGRVELSSGTIDSTIIQASPPTPKPNRHGYDLSNDRSWITWNERKILWLPFEYRAPKFSRFAKYVISSLASPSTGSTNVIVGIGCKSNMVMVLGLTSSGPFGV